MHQADKNRLYNLACRLDNWPRVSIPKSTLPSLSAIPEKTLDRLRMQDKTDKVYIVFTETELDALADEIRNTVARDGGAA